MQKDKNSNVPKHNKGPVENYIDMNLYTNTFFNHMPFLPKNQKGGEHF